MDDSSDQYDYADTSICVKEEPEIIAETIDSSDLTSGICILENMEEETNNFKNRRRSKRARFRNNRYKSDDEIIIMDDIFPSDSPSNNGKNSDKDFILQEPASFITTEEETCHKSSRSADNDHLAEILKQIKLYDELYVLLKSRSITAEALKYMETRHIDDLFKGTRLGTKIIFEHRLKEWQNKNVNNELTPQTSTENAKVIQEQQKLSEQLSSTINEVLGEADFKNLANLLTNAVQKTINSVLQEFKQSYQKQPKVKPNNNQMPIAVLPCVRKIKVEPHCDVSETVTSDKILNKPIRQNIKLLKVPDDILLSNQTVDLTSASQTKKRKLDAEIKVKEILLSYPIGQQIFDEYKQSNVLTTNLRSNIVRCIVDFWVRKNRSITIANCREIAEEIVKLFPTECLETYFIQDNKQLPPKGKIWENFQLRKRKGNILNASLEKDPQSNDSDDNIITKPDWSEMKATCSQMKNLKNDIELFEKWKDSFAYRRHQLQTGHFVNWKLYFDEYPFCKQQNYTQFIESDLDALYPNLKFNDFLWNEFLDNFETIFSNRIKHPKSKLLFEQLVSLDKLSTSSDYIAIKVIELLHAVLKNVNVNNKSDTVEDAQRKFTVEVNDLSELKKVVIERKKQCTEHNTQAKPYIAIVGQNKDYSHFSVILDSTGFSCDNYKDSLILCFNLYLFFDISFPHESLNVWTFIQKYFFNKPPLIRNPKVETFISDIRGQKSVNLNSKTSTNGTK